MKNGWFIIVIPTLQMIPSGKLTYIAIKHGQMTMVDLSSPLSKDVPGGRRGPTDRHDPLIQTLGFGVQTAIYDWRPPAESPGSEIVPH